MFGEDVSYSPRSLAFCCLTVVAVGCATTEGAVKIETGPAASDYAPLKVGASWTYAMTFLGQKGEMTIEVLGERDGYFYDNKGGMLRHTPDGLRDQKRYLIRTPLRAGEKWKSVVSASAVEHYEILSVGSRCEAEAGSFPDCLVVQSSVRRDADMTLVIRWTWARNVGLVKVETEANITGKGVRPQTKQSLLRYSLPGGAVHSTKPAEPAEPTAPSQRRGETGSSGEEPDDNAKWGR